MSKEIRNIDQLFQTELSGLAKKAPASVKRNVNKAIGTRSFRLGWILGGSSAVLVVLIGIYLFSGLFQSSETLLGKNELELDGYNEKLGYLTYELTGDTNLESENIGPQENSAELNYTEIRVDQHDSKNNLITSLNSDKKQTKVKQTKKIKPLINEVVFEPNLDAGDDIILDKKNTIYPPTVQKDDSLITDKIDKAIIETKDDIVVGKDENNTSKPFTDSLNAKNLVLTTDSSSNSNQVTIIDSSLADPDIELSDEKELYSPWFFGLTAGINGKKSTFATSISGDESAYGTQLKDKLGHSALFDVSYRLKNSLTFGAGIGYTSLYENYNFYKADIVVTDTNYITNYYLDSIPDSASMTGWAYFTDSIVSPDYIYGANEYYNVNGTNSTTYLNIPIRFGTQLIFSKWRLDLFVGGRFNLLLASKSTYIENGQVFYTNNQGFKNSYFDLTFGGSAHFEIYNNLFLSSTVRYRPPLNSAYYSQQITNRFQNIYVGLGLSLSL